SGSGRPSRWHSWRTPVGPGPSLAPPRVGAQSSQALAQPLARRSFSRARAGGPVGPAGDAAVAGGLFDEVLGAAAQATPAGVVVLALQVVARGGRIVPSPVALEAAAGVTERGDQGADLAVGAWIDGGLVGGRGGRRQDQGQGHGGDGQARVAQEGRELGGGALADVPGVARPACGCAHGRLQWACPGCSAAQPCRSASQRSIAAGTSRWARLETYRPIWPPRKPSSV